MAGKKGRTAVKASKPVEAPKGRRSVVRSAEFVRDSDESSSNEESGSEEAGSEESGSEPEAELPVKRANPVPAAGAAKTNGAKQSSPSATESDSDSNSSTSDQSDETQKAQPDVEEAATAAVQKTRQDLFGKKSYANDYKPPAGFSAPDVKAEVVLSPELAKTLSETNLLQKQLWHISVPAHIPVSQLGEVSLQSIDRGSSIFSYRDSTYHFNNSEADEIARQAVFLPSNGTYKKLDVPLARHVYMSQDVKYHTSVTGQDESSVAAVAQRRYERPLPPEQPSGLRMRNQPLGVIEDKDIDMVSDERKRSRDQADTELVHRQVENSESADKEAERKAEKRARREQKRLAKEKKEKKKKVS